MTLTRTEHPSYLALDRAALGGLSQDLERHVSACAECRSYLETLAEPPPESGLMETRRRLERARVASRPWLWAAIPVAAAAIALLFVTQPPVKVQEAPYVGVKGFSSVWIYVRRGADTQLWDGKRVLRPGDQLRLKVDPGAARHVEVYALKDGDSPERLYSGDLVPGELAMLPDAWELDDQAGAEQLFVVLSEREVKPRWPAWRDGKVAPGVVVLPFRIPKSTLPDADASDGSP
jgi:hypothetical protein